MRRSRRKIIPRAVYGLLRQAVVDRRLRAAAVILLAVTALLPLVVASPLSSAVVPHEVPLTTRGMPVPLGRALLSLKAYRIPSRCCLDTGSTLFQPQR